MRTVLVVAVWLAWAAGSVWLLRVVTRDRAEAESWRHRAAVAEAALGALAEQSGWWRCACGHVLRRDGSSHMCGGVRHTPAACTPVDDL